MEKENQDTTTNGNGEAEKAEKSGVITICVKDQTGEETFFKVKPHTKMTKIFTAYAERKGVAQGVLRFMMDGKRINEFETPKMVRVCLFYS